MLEYGSELIIVAAYMVTSILGAHERDPKVHHFCSFRVQESKNQPQNNIWGHENL